MSNLESKHVPSERVFSVSKKEFDRSPAHFYHLAQQEKKIVCVLDDDGYPIKRFGSATGSLSPAERQEFLGWFDSLLEEVDESKLNSSIAPSSFTPTTS